MINRDFSKSNKTYFNQNKIPLIVLGVFLIIGILVMAIGGFNANFEFTGCNEFKVVVGTDYNSINDYNFSNIIANNGGEFETVMLSGEGDETSFVVRYQGDLSQEQQDKINSDIEAKFDKVDSVGSHFKVGSSVDGINYIYTAVAVLLIITLSSIFAFFRYNGASSMSIIISSLIGLLSFFSLDAVLRISIGSSIFAMTVIMEMLIVYACINIFESIKDSSFMSNKDFANAMKNSMKETKFRTMIVTFALFVAGLLFVLFVPATLKIVSLNILFMAVVFAFVATMVIPFVWNVFITKSKNINIKSKDKQIDNTNKETNSDDDNEINETSGNATIGG